MIYLSSFFGQHQYTLVWNPIILSVHEVYNEEALDWKLYQLLPQNQHIEKVLTYKVIKSRLIGDIGLRGYFQLRRHAMEMIRSAKRDFVYPLFFFINGPYWALFF